MHGVSACIVRPLWLAVVALLVRCVRYEDNTQAGPRRATYPVHTRPLLVHLLLSTHLLSVTLGAGGGCARRKSPYQKSLLHVSWLFLCVMLIDDITHKQGHDGGLTPCTPALPERALPKEERRLLCTGKWEAVQSWLFLCVVFGTKTTHRQGYDVPLTPCTSSGLLLPPLLFR